VKNKLEEHGFSDVAFVEIIPGKSICLGPFELGFIRVSHSTVDGVGLAVKTPEGMIVHTGDFKIGHGGNDAMTTDVNRFAQCGAEGVLVLMSDSTNVEAEGYTLSDQSVADSLQAVCEASSGRVIVALFASNVARIQQIVDIAKKRGSKLIFSGRSVEMTVGIAKKLGFLSVPEGMEIDVKDVDLYPTNKIVMLTTGSQGEPMSALARIAAGSHRHIKIEKDDTVILSSKMIPGNEKAISNIINSLYKLGANVVYERTSNVHVSGHAYQEELKMMIRLTKPQYFIPIHGEYRHLVHHARLARSMGIPTDRIILAENGQVIAFENKKGRIIGKIPTGRVLVDGKGVGDVGRSVLKERQMLSEDGLVVVTIVFDEETGIIMYGPEIVSRGFVFWTATGHLLDDAQCVILEVIEEVGPDAPHRIDVIRSKIQKALRQYFNFTIKRRPIIVPVIMAL